MYCISYSVMIPSTLWESVPRLEEIPRSFLRPILLLGLLPIEIEEGITLMLHQDLNKNCQFYCTSIFRQAARWIVLAQQMLKY